MPGEITFIGTAGGPNVFTVKNWEYIKAEVPDGNMENIEVEIELDMTSIDTPWKDMLKSVKKKAAYFYVKKYPTASIKVSGAELVEGKTYKTNAMVQLKNIEKPVELTFTAKKKGKAYVIEGSGMIMRRDFKFNGDGPEEEVPVKFAISVSK